MLTPRYGGEWPPTSYVTHFRFASSKEVPPSIRLTKWPGQTEELENWPAECVGVVETRPSVARHMYAVDNLPGT
jgi:hypothetical protein